MPRTKHPLDRAAPAPKGSRDHETARDSGATPPAEADSDGRCTVLDDAAPATGRPRTASWILSVIVSGTPLAIVLVAIFLVRRGLHPPDPVRGPGRG